MKLYLVFGIKTGGTDKDKVLRWYLEAVAWRCSAKKNFSKIFENLQKSIPLQLHQKETHSSGTITFQ